MPETVFMKHDESPKNYILTKDFGNDMTTIQI